MSVNVSPNPHAQNNKLVRKINSEDFYVLRENEMPAVLTELAFLDNST
ncbi:N-acetylmuramoyl-L-alanine amidase, partial [Bacillus cereus]|nr:N-acetylmuramoyl-L-alanine amidase [Bacillus cereus]